MISVCRRVPQTRRWFPSPRVGDRASCGRRRGLVTGACRCCSPIPTLGLVLDLDCSTCTSLLEMKCGFKPKDDGGSRLPPVPTASNTGDNLLESGLTHSVGERVRGLTHSVGYRVLEVNVYVVCALASLALDQSRCVMCVCLPPVTQPPTKALRYLDSASECSRAI